MKIRINQDIVEFTPENPAEKTELEALWIKMANCIGKTKRLEPMGTYIPSEDKTAMFHIECPQTVSRPSRTDSRIPVRASMAK